MVVQDVWHYSGFSCLAPVITDIYGAVNIRAMNVILGLYNLMAR